MIFKKNIRTKTQNYRHFQKKKKNHKTHTRSKRENKKHASFFSLILLFITRLNFSSMPLLLLLDYYFYYYYFGWDQWLDLIEPNMLQKQPLLTMMFYNQYNLKKKKLEWGSIWS